MRLALGHRHRWEIDSETFSPPLALETATGTGEELALAVLYGLTTVVQRCSRCGELRAFTIAGRTDNAT
jgi:hypothetical protein